MKNFIEFLYDAIVGNFMIILAYFFAKNAHKNQKRKYTNEAYFTHCVEVFKLSSQYNTHWTSRCAALLHDTVEDVDWVSQETLFKLFGGEVASKVYALTNCDKSQGNRALRNKIDNHRLKLADSDVQNIKLCDIKSNCKSIVQHDKKFAKVYLQEKLQQAEGLTNADKGLRQEVISQLNWYIVQLKESS